jgi:putative glycosyltransferase (exosortase G-associated)
MNILLPFAVFWGVWLLVPIVIDGFSTLVSLLAVLVLRARRGRNPSRGLDYYPLLSVIVPVYNSADTLEACLRSIAAQEYPKDRMEILLVNNGSRDTSFEVFARLQGELRLALSWHSIINQGKAWALNAGIHLASGQYIFNVDSDVVLAPDAFLQVVMAMEAEPDLGAVTGGIEVLPPAEDCPLSLRLLAECEFFEYLTAFRVGRVHQTILQSLYTLSGAFSVFRREVILGTFLYSQETVTEDTDLTFEIYERFRGWRLACITSAVAYVHPIPSLSALYAQRVRWQRGQIEVTARHNKLLRRPVWNLRGFSPARVLAVDHTLAFPRIVWTFLMPILVFFGYPLSLILAALIVLYGFYMLIDLAWVLVAWLGSDGTSRDRLRRFWWLLPAMPLYRMIVFWFRFSGFLHAVAEPGTWRVQDPVEQISQGFSHIGLATREILRRLLNPKEVLAERMGASRIGGPGNEKTSP